MTNHLADWRKAHGLTAKEAAAAIKVSRGTWWRWETGRSKIAVSLLPAVARFTGLAGAVLRPDIQHLVAGDVNGGSATND